MAVVSPTNISSKVSNAQASVTIQDSKSAPDSLASKVKNAATTVSKAVLESQQKTGHNDAKNQPVLQYASIVKKDKSQTKSVTTAVVKPATLSSQASFSATKKTPEESQKQPQSVGEIKVLKHISDAHQDDIHAMIDTGSNTFVTGSKDGGLRLWNQEELVRDVWIPDSINYQEWITALAPLGANNWLSGTRNGYVDLWENSGERVASLEVNATASSSYKCKERNASRVNCIAQDLFSQGDPIFYIGRPTQFTVHRLKRNNPKKISAVNINSCTTSKNDWVYCVTPLAPKKVMVVTGARLDIFEAAKNQWKQTALIKEEYSKDTPPHQRPFISCVTQLQNQPGNYGLAVFGGPVTIINIETQRIVKSYHEHKKRVWTVENIRENIIASCSDDHTIKIWDLRLAKSALTLDKNIGRVSTLLRMSEHSLISGSCPDDLNATSDRARLTFWDIRKL